MSENEAAKNAARAERDVRMPATLLRPLRCIKVRDWLYRLDAAEDKSAASLLPIEEGAHFREDPSAELFLPFEKEDVVWQPLSASSRIYLAGMPVVWCDTQAETHFVNAESCSFAACRLAVLARTIGGVGGAQVVGDALYMQGRRGLGVLARRNFRVLDAPALW